jgi:hypothetical protein
LIAQNAAAANPRIRKSDDICPICDRSPKLSLSRPAQHEVFALWVFACGVVGS